MVTISLRPRTMAAAPSAARKPFTTPYKIEGGKVITKVQQDTYSLAIYKQGDTCYGARSNEFGYANYEIIPYPQFVQNPVTAALNQFSIELGLTQRASCYGRCLAPRGPGGRLTFAVDTTNAE